MQYELVRLMQRRGNQSELHSFLLTLLFEILIAFSVVNCFSSSRFQNGWYRLGVWAKLLKYTVIPVGPIYHFVNFYKTEFFLRCFSRLLFFFWNKFLQTLVHFPTNVFLFYNTYIVVYLLKILRFN